MSAVDTEVLIKAFAAKAEANGLASAEEIEAAVREKLHSTEADR